MARATATATITFGLVGIPVKVYVSASSETVRFNQLVGTTRSRIKQTYVDGVTGETVTRDQLVKGYEYAKDQFVVFTEEELKTLETATTHTVDVQEFVPADSIDPIAIEKTYYLGPDKGGDKGYTLLASALAESGKVAVAQWSKGGRTHLVTLAPHRGGLVMRIMFYKNETRDFNEVLDNLATVTISEPEHAMANQLVAALSATAFDPSKYSDAYAAAVRKAAEDKVASESFVLAPAAAPNPRILDVFEALKKSLVAAQEKKATAAPQAPPAAAKTPKKKAYAKKRKAG